jgi:hypothetical protein
MADNVFWCCESNLPIFGPSDFRAQDGEEWTCLTCGERWYHVCDEAEGCSWEHRRRESDMPSATERSLDEV